MLPLILIVGLISFSSVDAFGKNGHGNVCSRVAADNAPQKILMVASNKAVNNLGIDVGFYAPELTHAYFEFIEAGYEVTICSPDGGDLYVDDWSNPASEMAPPDSKRDFVSHGFLLNPVTSALILDTPKMSDFSVDDFDAIWLVGGVGPMFTFIDNEPLHELFAEFYEHGKIAAAICHGTNVLLKAKTADGKLLASGKTWTGFTDEEEDNVDGMVGTKFQPFRIQEEAEKIEDTTFVAGPMHASHAIRDGNLITGQQQQSGVQTAQLVIEALNGKHC